MRIKNCKEEKFLSLSHAPQIFKPLTPKLLILSAAILLSLIETNLEQIGEMTIFEFPTSQWQRERSEPISKETILVRINYKISILKFS